MFYYYNLKSFNNLLKSEYVFSYATETLSNSTFSKIIRTGSINKATGKLVRRKRKRRFSQKQLAAQRLFAKRARAGTLRKRRR